MAIAAGPAILGAAAIGVAGSIAAGAMGSNAANQAATTQSDASVQAAQIQADASVRAAQMQADSANRAVDVQNAQYQQSRADMAPWMEAGSRALTAYMGELGISDEAKAGKFKSQFEAAPGYQYQVAEAEKGVVNNLAALGLKGSGAALKALTQVRQNLADQTYQNYLTRVGNVATGGQQAVNDNAVLGANSAANAGNYIIGGGNAAAGGIIGSANAMAGGLNDSAAARASGYIGGANAWGNALGNISNTVGNALGWYSRGWAA